MDRKNFYSEKILKYIKNKNSHILVLGAGSLDREIFLRLGYKNVTFSNIENSDEKKLNFSKFKKVIHDIFKYYLN